MLDAQNVGKQEHGQQPELGDAPCWGHRIRSRNIPFVDYVLVVHHAQQQSAVTSLVAMLIIPMFAFGSLLTNVWKVKRGGSQDKRRNSWKRETQNFSIYQCPHTLLVLSVHLLSVLSLSLFMLCFSTIFSCQPGLYKPERSFWPNHSVFDCLLRHTLPRSKSLASLFWTFCFSGYIYPQRKQQQQGHHARVPHSSQWQHAALARGAPGSRHTQLQDRASPGGCDGAESGLHHTRGDLLHDQ